MKYNWKIYFQCAEKTLNPQWYEEFEFYLYEGDSVEQCIEVTVMDKRKNVCMGKYVIRPRSIIHCNESFLDLG